jgi:hypothetical protein
MNRASFNKIAIDASVATGIAIVTLTGVSATVAFGFVSVGDTYEVDRWVVQTIPVNGPAGGPITFVALLGQALTASIGSLSVSSTSGAGTGVPSALRKRYVVTRPDIRRVK